MLRIIVTAAAEHIGALVEALHATGIAAGVNVMNGGDNSGLDAAFTALNATPATVGTVEPVAPVTPRTPAKVRRVGSGVASKVLMPAPRMTADRLAASMKDGKIKLTPIEQRVAAVVFRHAKKGGIPEAGVVKETGANFHSVSGAVYSLRGAKGSKPTIIQSVPITPAK